MRLIKVGMANVDSTVGAFTSNMDKIIQYAEQMSREKCMIGCFSEQVISGYPCEDLVQWESFVKNQWSELKRFALATAKYEFPTVFVLGITDESSNMGGQLYNAAAVICCGRWLGVVHKEKLPTYGVFYEKRTFSSGIPGRIEWLEGVPFGDMIFELPFGTMGVEICEDIWTPDGPMKRRAYSGAEIIVNISASPFRAGVVETRRELVSTRASDNEATVIYVNLVGGQDALVFDGGGFVNQNGKMILEAARWCEGITTAVIDLDQTARSRRQNTTWRIGCEDFLKGNVSTHVVKYENDDLVPSGKYQFEIPKQENFFLPYAISLSSRLLSRGFNLAVNPGRNYFEDLVQGAITGLDGYFSKTKVFKKIGIALSGGKDSVLTLILAWIYANEKFGRDVKYELGAFPPDIEKQVRSLMKGFICCFYMSTDFSSQKTLGISESICDELGVSLRVSSIQEAFLREIASVQEMLGPDEKITTTTLQNIQARIRGMRMWNWSNSSCGLWLQTGNMSEKAVGYTTVGGDMMGSYSLLGNIPKSVIRELLAYLGEKYALKSVETLLATKESAELAEGQEDEKDLMPFSILDSCIYLFVGEKLGVVDMYSRLRSTWTDEELKKLYPDYQYGMLKSWVKKFVRLFFASIFKWTQAPLAVHLGSLDLDRERALQLPVVQSLEWLRLEELDTLPD